ncbi:hypothetical protein F542_3010 [Bibersteinia trehalosi USDA-ARS-USMARC-188]|uniref:Uncharacterized protein n=2 Tax=Bibersteinia trehalosi TaxID=47735 RepID=W0R9P5_BIBTR|nr:hypothetical protein F542_3010 [Bibersteinia trehalosi USDA-ARS-USMARC-188]AHG87167.1 hypothetical protein F544_19390 [Bibersteinia trehalosi USDA-ARS-USMARC-190]
MGFPTLKGSYSNIARGCEQFIFKQTSGQILHFFCKICPLA